MSVKQLNFSFQDFGSIRLQFPLDMQTLFDILYPFCLNKKSKVVSIIRFKIYLILSYLLGSK